MRISVFLKKKKEACWSQFPRPQSLSPMVFFLPHSTLLFLPLFRRPQSSHLYPFSITLQHPSHLSTTTDATRSLGNIGTRLLPATQPARLSAHFQGQGICSSSWFSLSCGLCSNSGHGSWRWTSRFLSPGHCVPLLEGGSWSGWSQACTGQRSPSPTPSPAPRGTGLPVRRKVRPSIQSRPK